MLREIAAIQNALKRLGLEQADALNAIETELDERSTRARKVLAELGPSKLNAPVPVQETKAVPVGGPFIPLSQAPEDAFMKQVFRIRHVAAEHERMIKQFDGLPVLLPILGEAEITSGFGTRVDPFLRQLAFHSGVDLRGDTGDPVRAACPALGQPQVLAVRFEWFDLFHLCPVSGEIHALCQGATICFNSTSYSPTMRSAIR
jgi:murein DD-endopeptidase MepM/ murein hydrolase activator NlpD